MIGRPGSTLWLLGCELRLTWRGVATGRRAAWRIGSLAVVGVVLFCLGLPVAFMLRDADLRHAEGQWCGSQRIGPRGPADD